MTISKNLKGYIASVIATSTFIFSTQTFAGAFQLWEESASSLGDYHAGAAAEANNASTVFYNPAGMSRIKHQQISFGAVFIDLNVNFKGNVTSALTFPNTTSTSPSGESGDTFNIVPNFHYVLPLNNRWAFGLEETTPFGLATKYTDNEPNSYVGMLATKTDLQTVNLNPSLSYAINQYLSIGAGFDALYGEAIYDDSIYLSPLTNKLTGWGYGYNAGVLVQFTPETRMGLSYRSPITVKATGPSALGLNTSTVSANFPLPATTMLSVYHDLNHRLAVMASAFYTQWSCFNQLIIKNMAQNSGTATAVINENYRNTWNLAVGSRYKFNQHIALEAGFGHDQTPTQLPYRDIRLPDNNRYVASVGVNIHPRKDFEWSMGWTHLFTRDTPVDNSGSLSNQSTVPAANFAIGKGTVHSSVNVFGIQFTWDV